MRKLSWVPLLVTACSPPAAATCPDCEIELALETSLRDTPEAPLEMPLSASYGGEKVATISMTSPAIALFADDGKLLRQVDREGQGPGEFVAPVSIQALDDGRVIVLDAANQRRVELDAELGVLEETSLLFTPQVRGHLVGQGFEIALSPNNVVTMDGKAIRPTPLPGMWFLGPASDTTFWLLGSGTHGLEEVSGATGQTLREIEIPDWFQPAEPTDTVLVVPTAALDVRQEDGIVWVLSQVPDPDWSGPLPVMSELAAKADEIGDMVVEAFDAETGRLLQTVQLDGYYQQFLAGPRLLRVAADPAGAPVLELHKLSLVRGNTPQEPITRR